MRIWFSRKCWGLLNFGWGKDPTFGDERWGIHFVVLHRDEWHWGRVDDEYDNIMTYWGLGPLGFISRVN